MKKIDKKTLYLMISFPLIVIGLLLICISLVLNNNQQNEKDSNLNDNPIVNDNNIDENEDGIQDKFKVVTNEEIENLVFYKYNEETKEYEKINKYKNKENYYVVCGQFVCLLDFENGRFILHSDNEKYLYVNLESNIFEEYDYALAVYNEEYEQETYIVSQNNKYGLIDLNGKYLYDLKANKINEDGTFEENNKYGLLNLHTGEVIENLSKDKTEKLYDLIHYYWDNNYYKVLKNGKWKVYSIIDNELVINKSFDDIHYIKDDYFFEVDDNEGYIINKNGERLNSTPIPVYFEINTELNETECNFSSIDIYETEDPNILEIRSLKKPCCENDTGENVYHEDVTMYKFDFKTNEITKLN